jgi:F0F1-type ATP synthase alpha subunit
VIVIYAATSGYLDSGGCRLSPLRTGLLRFIENSHPSLGKQIADKKQLDDSMKAELNKVLDEFKERFAAERKSK